MIKKIDKFSPLPMYYQLQTDLISKINAGQLKSGDCLPSEKELMRQYNVSRTTVRTAVANLVTSGHLEKRRGVGTFVRPPHLDTNQWELNHIKSFQQQLEAEGHRVSTKVLAFEKIQTSPELTQIFTAKETDFYRIKRLRYSDNNPIVFDTTFLPMSLAAHLEQFNLNNHSLFQILQTHYQIKLCYGEKILQASSANQTDAEVLKLNVGDPIQTVKTKTYSDQNRLVEYSISHDSGAYSEYKILLHY